MQTTIMHLEINVLGIHLEMNEIGMHLEMNTTDAQFIYTLGIHLIFR